MNSTLNHSRTSPVRHIRDGSVAFSQLNSWYDFPSHTEPLFRIAKETGRTFTVDRYHVLSAKLAPVSPTRRDRSKAIAALLWPRLTQRR